MISMHKSYDDTYITTHFVWDDKESYENCVKSPDFAEINKIWAELMQNGSIKFELNTYDLVF